MLKRILLILVGGTICTRKNEYGTLSISSEAGVMLKENYLNSDSVYADDVYIESTRDMYILSENMTVDRWNSIIALYTESVKDGGYDGVVLLTVPTVLHIGIIVFNAACRHENSRVLCFEQRAS